MKKKSLRKKLITIFIITSMIPMIFLCIYMLFRTSRKLQNNTKVLTENNLEQIDDNMQIWLESYEDILYQIYTSDDMVAWLDKLSAREDEEVTVNQMRRYLRILLNTKDYIRAITVITDNGQCINYNQLTPATYESAWLENFSMQQQELYEDVSRDSKTHVYPTEYATSFANEDYYLFHIAHRVIDYRKLEKKCGIVVISLDETLLQQILTKKNGEQEFEVDRNILVDQNGRIISCDIRELIGEKLSDGNQIYDDKIKNYRNAIKKIEEFKTHFFTIYCCENENLGWDIVHIEDQRSFLEELIRNLFTILGVYAAIIVLSLLLILKLTGQVTNSVDWVVRHMRAAEDKNLSVRIPVLNEMSQEIELIADQFNGTLEKLEESQKKKEEADEKQRQAEIKALEAQINPHFLYNTLDTINWMAIDKDEFDISNAINTLALILRYAISDSNAIVSVRDEMEWLKKYIYLQQFRLDNKFCYHIDIDQEIMEWPIHKLIFQPFVENAIIHGFSGIQEQYQLTVSLKGEEERLIIIVADNGRGIDQDTLERIRNGIDNGMSDKYHIGLGNAINRMHIYYKGEERIEVESQLGKGTKITIYLPHVL